MSLPDADRLPIEAGLMGELRRDARAGAVEIVETKHAPGDATGWHRHVYGHLCLVIAGSVSDASIRTTRPLGPGALIWFPPGAPHSSRFSRCGARCLNIRFLSARTVRNGNGPLGFAAPSRIDSPQLAWAAGCLHDQLVQETWNTPESVLPTVLAHLATPRRSVGDVVPPEEVGRTFLEERWRERPRLAEVAEHVGLDRFQLARAFRRQYGCSVDEYRHRIQVREAKHALLATDASLGSIAYQTGFADQSHFTRLFHRYTRLTPAAYRRRAG